jgi:hypothetical protein
MAENPHQIAMDTYVLLGLGIVVLMFIAYELAGLMLPGWHTISFIAKHHRELYLIILAAFMLAGLVGPAWWVYHINWGTISR